MDVVLKIIAFHLGEQETIRIPSVQDRDDSGLPLCDRHERGLRHVKVDPGRVAPAAIVWILRPVRRAEVRGSHGREGNSLEAPLRLDTLDLIASPTAVTVLEQGGAQRSGARAVPVREQISVSTSSSCEQTRETWRLGSRTTSNVAVYGLNDANADPSSRKQTHPHRR